MDTFCLPQCFSKSIRFCAFKKASTHLFDGEVVNEVMVVLVEAAVQGYTVRVDEQVLQGGHSL